MQSCNIIECWIYKCSKHVYRSKLDTLIYTREYIHETDLDLEIIQSGCFKSKEMIARTKTKKAFQTKHQTDLR